MYIETCIRHSVNFLIKIIVVNVHETSVTKSRFADPVEKGRKLGLSIGSWDAGIFPC